MTIRTNSRTVDLERLVLRHQQSFSVMTKSGLSICFVGWRVCMKSSEKSGSRRWCEIGVWLTVGGKWVIQQVGRSSIEGESDFFSCWVLDRKEEMIAKLGVGRLSMRVYEDVGLDNIPIE
jgi:hypothetical protein